MVVKKRFLANLYDSFLTIYPVIIVVLVLSAFIPISSEMLIAFLISVIILILGTALFTFGSELSLAEIGKKMGNSIIKSKKLWLILGVSLILGTILTIAEPDLRVLASQVTSIPSNFLIVVISLGVGLFMVIAALRSIFGWNLNIILLISYVLIGILTFVAPEDLIPFAYDSGGVTTGTISIPFIITLGVGLVSSRTDRKAKEDQFGLVALCSTGPIIMVILLSMLFKLDTTYDINSLLHEHFTIQVYLSNLVKALKDTMFSIAPIIVVFIIYQMISKGFSKKKMNKICYGLFFVVVGLIMFLLSVNVGFMDIAMFIGKSLSQSKYPLVLVPLIMVFAFFTAIAEPAVKVLVHEIDALTGGTVDKSHISIAIALGVSISAALSLIRIYTHTSFIYYAIPCYAVSLILMFFIPKYFAAIAFDVGGATGGTLTTAFLLPMVIGACDVYNGNVLTEAFGLAAFTSIIPIITVECVGVLYTIRTSSHQKIMSLDDSIISFEEVTS